MKDTPLIREFMTNDVVCANLNNKLSQVMEYFTLFKRDHLPVLDQSKLVGIISVNDIVWFLHKHLQSESLDEAYLDSHFNLESIMTRNPITIEPESTLDDALAILSKGDFQALPVTHNGTVVGMVSNKDIVRALKQEHRDLPTGFNIETPGFGV